MSPSIALVIPLRNEATVLPELLQAVRRLPVNEVMLVDGGSSDGTQAVLADSGLRWISSPAGRGRQMNAGAACCHSDILLFLHADTQVDNQHIVQLRTLFADPGAQSGRFDVQLSGEDLAFALISYMINFRSRISKIATGDQAIFVRRLLFERMGGFPELPLMEDIAFSRRLKREGGVRCLRARVITSSRRWRQGGILRTILLMWTLRLGFYLGVPAE
ncbi:MAG: TIGR04283 family arsenosugar biosynthesis glycosyltransferase, partial [Mariprofundales bacterium]